MSVTKGARSRRMGRRRVLMAFTTGLAGLVGATIVAVPASATVASWTTSNIQPVTSLPAGNDQAVADAAGNRYVVGHFTGTVVFGPGAGGTVAAEGNDSLYVASYTSAGTFRWVRRIGNGLIVQLGGIAASANGTVAVVGSAYGAEHISTPYGDRVLPAYGNLDFFVVTLGDSDGHIVWAHSGGGAGPDRATGVTVDGYGDVYLVDSFSQSAAFGDGTHTVTLVSAGAEDAGVVSYTAAGVLRFAKDVAAGGAGDDGVGIALGSGELIVTGTYTGSALMDGVRVYTLGTAPTGNFVQRLSSVDGSWQWTRLVRTQTSTATVGFFPVVATDGSLFLAGDVNGSAAYGPPGSTSTATVTTANLDVLVFHIASTGQLLWSRTGGSTDTAFVRRPIAGPSGSLVAAGSFLQSLPLGGANLDAGTGLEGFLAEWSSAGNVTRAAAFGGTGGDASYFLAGPATAPLLTAVIGAGTATFPGGATVTGPNGGETVVATLTPT